MYDVIVIGAGSAGSNCAEKVNEAGKRVALIERDALGGTCLNYGCDPTKTALHTVKILKWAQQGQRFSLRIPEAAAEWAWLQDRIREVQHAMRGGSKKEAQQKMRQRGIDLIMGEAQFVSPHEIQVGDRLLQGEQFLIATGTEPTIPDIPGLAQTGFVTNKDIFQLPLPPGELAITGGGPVGVEFAQLFARLGVTIHLLEAGPHILPQDDPELAMELASILEEEGISFYTGASLTRVAPSDTGKKVTITYDSGYEEQLIVGELLIAAGREPALVNLKLEAAGVQVEDGHIVTDAALRTNVGHIWAAGDVSSAYPFTHVAWRQGAHVAQNILNGEAKPFNSGPIPWVTYTDPELGHVGKTEKELKAENRPYRVLTQPLAKVARALATGQTNGRIKLLVGQDDQILGGHVLAANGGELLGPILLAMQAGLPVTALRDTVWPYPTMSAGLGSTAAQIT